MRESIAAARLSGPGQSDGGGAVFEFRFDAEQPVFAGHFPGRPVLPGIFQLEMTRAAAEWILHCPLSVNEIVKSKFERPIAPGETVRLILNCSESDGLIQARAEFSVDGAQAGRTAITLRRK
ncbi:MAG TPA: hypothetical protein VGO59_16405 [Verrucomicrobiae bacterium]